MKTYEDTFRAIFDASPDTIMLLDEHGFLDCNPATLDMFCCNTAEEFLGRHPGEYSPVNQPDGRASREAAEEKIATAYATGSSFFEWTHQRFNGELFPAEVQLTLLKLADGDVLQATVRDISKRKSDDAKIESLARFPDENPSPVLRLAADGTILYANVASRILLETWKTEVGQAAPLAWGEYCRDSLASGLPISRKESCDDRLFEMMIAPVKESSYANLYGQDVTERKLLIDANHSQIHRLESLQKITDAISSSLTFSEMLNSSIQKVREIFESDRAWLLYPCDVDADCWEVPVESTLPEYPGAFALNQKLPMSDELMSVLVDALNSTGPVLYCPMPSLGEDVDQFAVRSMMIMEISPKFGKPWLFGLHQCSYERIWTDEEQGLFHDIAARMSDVLSSEYLNHDLQKLSQAVQQAGEAVMITDRHATIEYVNPAFSAITGYAPEDIVGKTPAVLKSSAQDPAFYKELWETILQGNIWHGTLIDRRKDGSFYPALMSVAPIVGDEGETTHFVSLQQDMTEYKKLEEQFIQSQKMEAIGRLVGGIAHDFNNMLAAMQGNLYLAKTETQGESRVSERLDNIGLLSQRAADMVAQLLTFARKDRVSMQAFSLNNFMKDGFELARNAIPENVEHICDVCSEELVVKGDATQLQQALMNLLNNASHAVSSVKRPRIKCALSHFIANHAFVREHADLVGVSFARLSVSDNGCGISDAHMNKVFEPFFTTKSVGEGTGLGLAMVHGAIQTHGGVVEVESEVGKGTDFHVYLPLDDAETMPIEEQVQEAVRGQHETVLLVDDEPTMRETVGEVLTSMGYTVLEAADGDQALQLFKEKQQDIDLVISDIVMPVMGGIEAVQQMRLLNGSLPVVLMTGYDKNQSVASTDQIDGAVVLSKPFSFDLLSHTLRTLLGGD